MRRAGYFAVATLLAVAAASGPAARAAGAPAAAAQPAAPAEEQLTVITSDKLTFDYKNHFALFEQNVVVVDPQMRITADKMTVNFDDKNKVRLIKAEGRVVIVQEDKQAKSAEAVYDVDQGTVVLTGQPEVTRGHDVLTGRSITFWRDQNRMKVDSDVRLKIFPQGGGARNALLFGDPARGK
jgi:lipopolysaccharide export system protein LptA